MVKQTDTQSQSTEYYRGQGSTIHLLLHSFLIQPSIHPTVFFSIFQTPGAFLEAGKNTKLIQSNQTLLLSSSQYNGIASRKRSTKIRAQYMEAVSEMSEDSKENQTITQGSRELSTLFVLLYRRLEGEKGSEAAMRVLPQRNLACWPGPGNPTTLFCARNPILLQVLVEQEQKGQCLL